MDPLANARSWLACVVAGVALVLPSCTGDGQISLFGYTSRPNYDPTIHTVHVPIFKNTTLNTTVRRGLEFDLTQAVIREIEAKTPFKVVSDPACADTELTGTIVGLTKNIININPLNEVREAETVLTVQVIWRDLRPGHTGEILSLPKPPGGGPQVLPPPPPGSPPGTPPVAPPVIVQSTANFVPELGQSLTTAEQRNINRLAIQIVSMMEMPW
jgi:hypothetical protein